MLRFRERAELSALAELSAIRHGTCAARPSSDGTLKSMSVQLPEANDYSGDFELAERTGKTLERALYRSTCWVISLEPAIFVHR